MFALSTFGRFFGVHTGEMVFVVVSFLPFRGEFFIWPRAEARSRPRRGRGILTESRCRLGTVCTEAATGPEEYTWVAPSDHVTDNTDSRIMSEEIRYGRTAAVALPPA